MGQSSLLIKTPTKNLRSLLGAVRRRLRSMPFRTRWQRDNLLRDAALTNHERGLLRQVESRISPHDGMFTGNGAHYFKVGLSAIGCIEAAIDAAGLTSLRRALDLPCGHGRVLRFLVRRFPKTQFIASDLDRIGVDFCQTTFGASAVYSKSDLSQFSLEGKFDLIWCGSLVTHLDAAGIRALLAFFTRQLSPNGLLIITTHGDHVIHRMINREFEYGIPQATIPSIIESYRAVGVGFADYPGASGYGVSLTSPEWVRKEMESLGLKEVYFQARGWDDHQDVFGFQQSQ